MFSKSAQLPLSLTGMIVLLVSACSDGAGPAACVDEAGPGDQTDGRISIVNSCAALAARVTYYNSPIAIDDTGYASSPAPSFSLQASSSQTGGARMQAAAAAAAFSLRLVAEVAPPSIGGQRLQATSIVIAGNQAVVSYNMRGDPYLGGIDFYTVTGGVVLRSQALFQNTDVSAVSFAGANVYVAEATGDPGFQYPAAFEIMQLQGSNLILNGNLRMGLRSFAATSATVSGTRAYATSGNTGALYVIDPVSFTVTDSVSLSDARWVAVGGGKVVAVQGMPGQITVFDEPTQANPTLTNPQTFSFTGADRPEAKSTVQVVGGKAFIAAGSGGVQVLSASTGTVVGSVPRPNPASLGLPDSVVVTNAVAVDGNLLFISNGEAGVYVARGSQAFATTGSEAQQTITVLGRLRFGNLQSANHVAYVHPYLFVAAGLGGIKVVQVTF